MEKFNGIHISKKLMSFISVMLGLAALATTGAYLLYRYSSQKAYRQKWREYDECGLM